MSEAKKQQFTPEQIKNWREYERIRQSGAFNMFDPRARAMSSMSEKEWVFCIENYSALKEAA